MYLPNYGVFDEQRYFQSGAEGAIVEVNGVPIGISVCEDIWEPGPPAMSEALAGAQVIVNLSASPYRRGLRRPPRADAHPARRGLPVGRRVREHGRRPGRAGLRRPQPRHRPGRPCPRARAAVRGGAHALHDRPARDRRRAAARHAPSRERAPPAQGDADRGGAGVHARRASRPRRPASRRWCRASSPPRSGREAEIYAALRTGLHDYVEKNGFERVVIALSGGIDSALAALIAVDALGPERVTCVSMPSPYSSDGTRADARAIAENLGRRLPRDRDRPGDEGLRRAAARALRGARARTWPRRTCRRGSAATS